MVDDGQLSDANLRGLKVLLVGNDPEYFLMHRLALVRALAAEGLEMHVAIPFDRADARFHHADFGLHRLSLERGNLNPLQEGRTCLDIMALSQRLRPRLVHHVAIKPVLYGSLVARMNRTPAVVNSITGLGYLFSAANAGARILRSLVLPVMRYGCRRPNVTMLFENRDDLSVYSDLNLCDVQRSRVVPSSGVDPAAYRARVHGAENVTVMLLGRMLWDKGVREFVEAARQVSTCRRSTRFVLVGATDPNPESIPEKTLREWHEQGIVEYWGWRSDVAAVLGSADILCLPSYREGLPRSLLEGGAAGLGLITTDVPGCRDVVRAGVSGLVIPPRDAGALTKAILELIDDPIDARQWELRHAQTFASGSLYPR
jgi:glycosyltransferase involved in cell wall biosynthesis